MKSFYIFCAFISIISHHSGIESTLSQSDKKSKKDTVKVKKDTSKEGPIAASVYTKGLVTTKLSSKNDILDHYGNYHQDTTFHNFDGTVLGKFISFLTAGEAKAVLGITFPLRVSASSNFLSIELMISVPFGPAVGSLGFLRVL